MIKTFLSYLILFGLQNNIMIANGAGALEFQREKMYRSFRYLNAIFLILGIIIVSIATYFLNKFVYVKFNLEFISVTVVILLAGIYNFIVAAIWRKVSNFSYYLYNSTFSYPIDLVYTISVVLLLDMSVSIVNFLLALAAVMVVVLVMNAFFGFYVRSFNRGYMNVRFRNVASRLFMLAIFSLLLYYGALLAL